MLLSVIHVLKTAAPGFLSIADIDQKYLQLEQIRPRRSVLDIQRVT
jgi:hypothetical protein